MGAGPSDRQSSQHKNLEPIEKRKILNEQLKLFKNGALNYGDMKKVFEMMTVDRRQVSKVWKQYHKRLEESVDLNFETGCKHRSRRKNINIEEVN